MTQTGEAKRKLGWKIILIPIVLLAIATIFVVIRMQSTTSPTFPSLVDTPDSTLHGTVAYYDNPSRCIRVIAASGAISKDVMCMEDFDANKAKTEGKPVGWNLTWLADNRLEVTEFLMMGTPPSMEFKPGWQKVVDVVTGETVETAAGQIPALPTAGSRTTLSPNGDKISFTSDSGHGVVTLTNKAGKARVLLDVQGDPETYGLSAATWSPDFKWVAVDDGHLLITTVADPAQTRTLTPQLMTDYGYDALHWYDITATDLLP